VISGEESGVDAGVRWGVGFGGALEVELPAAEAADLGPGTAEGEPGQGGGAEGDEEEFGVEGLGHAVEHGGGDAGEEDDGDDVPGDEGAGAEDHLAAEGW